MKARVSRLPRELPRGFAEMNALHPLRPINDDVDLQNAYEIMDKLAMLDKRTKDQEDYLETLILLTEVYDRVDNELAFAAADQITGLESLKYLMENTEMTQAELARILGVGPSAVSMILSGQRPITADHARKLAKRFHVDPGLFL